MSIITPACNSGKYLEATIRSVQSQTWENWEMLIVDDASTDDTAAIALAFSAEDPRIRVIRLAENGGAAVARNRALEACSGRFVAYLDADDLWKPEKLQKQVAFMLQNHAAFSCTSSEVIADDGTPLNKVIHMLPRLDYRGFLTHNLLQTAGIMVDASKVVEPPVKLNISEAAVAGISSEIAKSTLAVALVRVASIVFASVVTSTSVWNAKTSDNGDVKLTLLKLVVVADLEQE